MDVIMPMAPIFYVLAPDYLRLLLHPVISYLDSGAWPHNYTIHDIGAHYPNATGHDNGEAQKMPVEESGNLLALMYMYELAPKSNSPQTTAQVSQPNRPASQSSPPLPSTPTAG